MVPESEVFRVGSHLLLNGLFGVEKNEEADGIPIYRLIMNLVPLNELCQPMAGDIGLGCPLFILKSGKIW